MKIKDVRCFKKVARTRQIMNKCSLKYFFLRQFDKNSIGCRKEERTNFQLFSYLFGKQHF